MDITDHEKDGFAHISNCEDPTCQPDWQVIGESLLECGGSGAGLEAATKRVNSKFANAIKLLPADGNELGLRGSRLRRAGR